MTKSSQKSLPDHVGKNALEWSIFVASSLLVTGMVAWLIHAAWIAAEPGVKLTVVTQEPIEQSGWYRVPVVVSNEGGTTVSGVEVTVGAEIDGRNEEASFALDFVPRGGTRRGIVSFRGNSEPRNITPIAMGFSEE